MIWSLNYIGIIIRKGRQFYFAVLFLFVFLQINGQPSLIFHHLTTEDGLSNNNARAIIKDDLGFLWIGTESGLNRYDGYNFKYYSIKQAEPGAYQENVITSLQKDGFGNIWVKIYNNYSIYDRNKDVFNSDISAFLFKHGIYTNSVNEVYVDKKKDLWVVSYDTIYSLNVSTKSVKIFKRKKEYGEYVSKVHGGSDDNFFIFLNSGYLLQLNKRNGSETIIEIPDKIKEEIPTDEAKLFIDAYEGIWFYSDVSDIIYYKKTQIANWVKLDLDTEKKTQSNVVQDILDDENGNVWICTDHSGLFIYNKFSNTFINYTNNRYQKSSIASNNIRCIFKDDDGVVWLGHLKHGLSYYHESFHGFTRVEDPECYDVSVIIDDRSGNIWIGTDGNGLFLHNNKQNGKLQKLNLPSNVVTSLLEDKKGRIWIGTFLNGLFCYDNKQFAHYTLGNSGLSVNNIWKLIEDKYGNIWILTLGGGIQRLSVGQSIIDSLVQLSDELPYPIDICYDGMNKLYIATVSGVYIYDIITGRIESRDGNAKGTQRFKQLLNRSVFIDSKNHLWMGHTDGITLWDMTNDTIYYINKDNGLCDNLVRSITEDNNSNIWVTTSNGVSLITLTKNERQTLKFSTYNFSTKDGLMDNSFNNNAICKLHNGDIAMGGPEGLSILNPNKIIEKNQPLTNILITSLSIGNNPILIDSIYNGHKVLELPIEKTKSITLNHFDRLIAFSFTTGDLLNADKVKFMYKMDGFDDQWLQVQGNKIELSSLPPGNYQLLMKAMNSDGVWNESEMMLTIKVRPPWYLSRLALVFYYTFVSGLIIFIIFKTRRNHRVKLEKQRMQLEREQEVNLNEMKLRFFTNISHDLRTPLTLIITPLQTILSGQLDDRLRKKLEILNKNAEQLLHIINSLLDFRKLDVGAESLQLKIGDFVGFLNMVCNPFHSYANERCMNFKFQSTIDRLSIQFDPEKVKKIFTNLLSNAFKYTPDGGSVEVKLSTETNYIVVSVSDTGQGISDNDKMQVFNRFYQTSQSNENTGSGIGLHIVKEYVNLHSGIIDITDNFPQGSIFTVKIPMRKVSANDELIIDEESNDQEEIVSIEEQNRSNLLFVDDNKDFCDFMEESLSDDYNVMIAYNGAEALELLENNDINVVVSDIMMPIMDGTELCNKIKTNIQWSHIPVILLTARTADEYKLEALEIGADDYITKPFNFNLLKLRINKFLEWRDKCHASFSNKIDISPSEITITSLDEKLIDKAINFVEEHMEETDFSVEELSEAVGLSRSHLYKKLMSITGKGPAEFIRTIRLKRGLQLLEKSQLQIAEIAYIVGFNSPKRFSINFKNEYGLSPSEYLKNLPDNTQ